MTRETFDNLLAFSRFEIDSNRTLAAIAGVEIGSGQITIIFRCNKGRAPCARIIARAGAFDFDHLRAQVGEILPAPRAGEHAGEVEHFDM